ncbi:ATP-binding protein [Rhodoluna sp.]|uniref:AAA family ATPase n=1 Tax=Rhodoluna sp. TaxID=1969481 RepID=UPI0025CF780B|nr:ATP-binding protein [Rhodoluna sp.]
MEQLAHEIAKRTLQLVDTGKSMPIVLIDGRSNSGKSTLAAEIQNIIFKDGESAPRVIHMDDLYPGWDGLAAGAEYLQRVILNPLSKNETAHWQEFNWAKNERDAWREFSGGTPLIIEGCGSLNQQSAQLADIKIWLNVDEETRQKRWLEREGSNEHWAEWAAQELDFYAREKSADLADRI